jgi:hypothetical protein
MEIATRTPEHELAISVINVAASPCEGARFKIAASARGNICQIGSGWNAFIGWIEMVVGVVPNDFG